MSVQSRLICKFSNKCENRVAQSVWCLAVWRLAYLTLSALVTECSNHTYTNLRGADVSWKGRTQRRQNLHTVLLQYYDVSKRKQ
jgi:hypothetical protein